VLCELLAIMLVVVCMRLYLFIYLFIIFVGYCTSQLLLCGQKQAGITAAASQQLC
jgi:hypothetical protein